MVKVLFVCLGNICRSPAAEGVFKKRLVEQGLTETISCDSCGTSGYHTGERADSRMRATASQRGYQLESLARQFRSPEDFHQFDYIMVMDGSNKQDVLAQAPDSESQKKVYMMTDFSENYAGQSVPDPYYGGEEGFDLVIDLLEDAVDGLIREIQA
jgi:protein-tyrosine phosphatase